LESLVKSLKNENEKLREFVHKSNANVGANDKYEKLKKEYDSLKKASYKLRQEYDDLESANEQLSEVITKEGEKDKSKIVALEIALKESTEEFRVAERGRIVLQEQMSTLYKIFDTVVNTNGQKSNPGEEIDAKVSKNDTYKNPVIKTKVSDEENSEADDYVIVSDEEGDDFEKTIQYLTINKSKGFNRKEGPAASPKKNTFASAVSSNKHHKKDSSTEETGNENNLKKVTAPKKNDMNTVNNKIMNRDPKSSNNVRTVKNLMEEGQRKIRYGGEEKTLFCHYFNNYKDCPWDQNCRFDHSYNSNCLDDGFCRRKMCSFQHPREAQSFLGMGPMRGWGGPHRDRDVRPMPRMMMREVSPYEARRRQREW